MPLPTRPRGNMVVARSHRRASPLGDKGADAGIDLGFATTVYGRDANGNLVRIDGAGADDAGTGDATGQRRPAWPTEQ